MQNVSTVPAKNRLQQVDDIVNVCQALAALEGPDMIGTHVSCRDNADSRLFLVNTSAAPLGRVRARHVLIAAVDTDHPQIGFSDRHRMFAEIYARRPDVRAIVHTHHLATVALGARFGEAQAWHIVSGWALSDCVVTSFRIGEAAAALSTDRCNSVLLRRHGDVAVGPDLPVALARHRALVLTGELDERLGGRLGREEELAAGAGPEDEDGTQFAMDAGYVEQVWALAMSLAQAEVS